jgi:DNA-binding MarR family transcriptional regulator
VAERSLREEIKKRDPFESPEQEAALNVARTHDRLQSGVARFFKEYGISGAQYNVLRILRGEGKPLPCQEISGRMITQLPDITRLVDRLEAAGLVERSRTQEDRRVVLTAITEAGRTLLVRIDEPLLQLHREQLGHLTREELSELNRLLAKARNPRANPETE